LEIKTNIRLLTEIQNTLFVAISRFVLIRILVCLLPLAGSRASSKN